jgi:hypothetical protein
LIRKSRIKEALGGTREERREILLCWNIYWAPIIFQSHILILTLICATALQGSHFHFNFVRRGKETHKQYVAAERKESWLVSLTPKYILVYIVLMYVRPDSFFQAYGS